MSKDTLILNADAQPISMLPISSENWREAIKLIWINRADVLHNYEDWEVHSPSTTIKVPSVIMLKDFVKMARSVKYCRENILIRDEYCCQYCGADYTDHHCDLTLDHVIPRYYGGPSNFDNIVASCPSCNIEKSHFMKMKPKNKPRRPSYYDLVNKLKKKELIIPHHAWKPYLGWDESLIRIEK